MDTYNPYITCVYIIWTHHVNGVDMFINMFVEDKNER